MERLTQALETIESIVARRYGLQDEATEAIFELTEEIREVLDIANGLRDDQLIDDLDDLEDYDDEIEEEENEEECNYDSVFATLFRSLYGV